MSKRPLACLSGTDPLASPHRLLTRGMARRGGDQTMSLNGRWPTDVVLPFYIALLTRGKARKGVAQNIRHKRPLAVARLKSHWSTDVALAHPGGRWSTQVGIAPTGLCPRGTNQHRSRNDDP